MKIQELPDQQLVDLYTAAWESVEHDCFSSSDVLVTALGEKELMRRGFTIEMTNTVKVTKP